MKNSSMGAGNMLDLDAAFGSLNQSESSGGTGGGSGQSTKHANMEHKPMRPTSLQQPPQMQPPNQHQQHMQPPNQHQQHMQPPNQHMQPPNQHQQHMQAMNTQASGHHQQHMQPPNYQQHMQAMNTQPPGHHQQHIKTGDAQFTALPPQVSAEEMQRRQTVMQQRAMQQKVAMQQMQMQQQQMQQQQMQQKQMQQQTAPITNTGELRTAAGGFARFAKRLNTDTSSGVFMWVSIVLVFIVVGILIALACRPPVSATTAAAVMPSASNVEYPF